MEYEKKQLEADNRLIEANSQIEYLSDTIVKLEKSVFNGLQHSRKSNIEIDGIPSEIGDDSEKLEAAALKILKAIGVDCQPMDIEAIHRLPARVGVKPTIIRFNNRKTAAAARSNKSKLKDLKSLNLDIDGLTDQSAIYIKPSLCPYYKTLSYNCRLLKRAKLIQNAIVDDEGVIKIKTLSNTYIKINHESELKSRFNEFKDFSF